jgi:hypothetical protein
MNGTLAGWVGGGCFYQAGAWSAIGFPVQSDAARAEFYSYANWTYQAGVFVSRSSGMLFQASRMQLWAMPVCQAGLLAFFVLDSVYEWWYASTMYYKTNPCKTRVLHRFWL